MKKIKFMFFITVFSINLLGSGEISFNKQKEKVLKEEQQELLQEKIESRSEPKKINVASKEKKLRTAILETAFTQMGVPYIYGANGNGAYDCSSYVQYVYRKALNLNLPRVSYEQANSGQKVSIKELRAGDLVAFDTLGQSRISHIGIYLGNKEFIHASSGYKKVVVSKLEGYYAEKFKYGVKII